MVWGVSFGINAITMKRLNNVLVACSKCIHSYCGHRYGRACVCGADLWRSEYSIITFPLPHPHASPFPTFFLARLSLLNVALAYRFS
jgi:hypothetical protein